MDEWRKAYINYSGLKKLIKRVEAHWRARREASVSVRSPMFPPSVRARTSEFVRRGSLLSRDSRVPDYGSTQDAGDRPVERAGPALPEVSLEGTGLSLADEPGFTQPVPATNADAANGAGPARTDVESGGNGSGFWARLQGSANAHGDEPVDARIARTFDGEEQKFFAALDAEIQRIEEFYLEREHEAVERLTVLVSQLSELAQHRREFLARSEQAMQGHEHGLSRFLSLVPKRLEADELNRARLTAQRLRHMPASSSRVDPGDKRRAQAVANFQALNIAADHAAGHGKGKEEPDGTHTPTTEAVHMAHDPVQYRKARKKLRAAVVENYRALEILNNYRILNRTGCLKILKKFDKTLGVAFLEPFYEARVRHTPIVVNDTVPKLLHATEEIFTSYFGHGDQKRARETLRQSSAAPSNVQRFPTHYASTFRTGLYLGVAVCALVRGLIAAMDEETRQAIPQWDKLMHVYGALFIPTLFALLFGVNLVAWLYVRINAVFIFEWDPANVLEPSQYFELPAFLMLVLTVFFWVSFARPYDHILPPTDYPIIYIAVVLAVLLNPLPIFHRSGRNWFVRSLVRVFGAGAFSSVEFRDFFLGDELNSLTWSMGSLWLIGCAYRAHWRPGTCDTMHTYWTPVLTSVAPLLRFGQCWRRFVDSNYKVKLHVVNAFKYSSTVLNAFFYFRYRYHDSSRHSDLVLWILFGCIYSIYTSSWDIVMDWNLLQPHSRYPLLRSNLAFEDVWPVYYAAMVTNVLLRFSWVIYLLPGPASVSLRSFIVALLEMFRRWQWNFVRLENEHLGNADSFKIVRDLPPPYPVQRKTAVHDEEDGPRRGSGGFSLSMLRTSTSRSSEESGEHADWVLERTKEGLAAARARRSGSEPSVDPLQDARSDGDEPLAQDTVAHNA